MTTIRVVAHPAVCAGFALAGVRVTEVSDPRSGAQTLADLADGPDLGVLLVEQELLDALGDPERRALLSRPSPIIVPFPSPAWAGRATEPDSYLLDLLQRAIGYRVRLR